jgi:preprotein translocase subunit SecG
MHDGKDAGLSGAFGVAGGSAGTQVMQRNLTRLTIVIAVLFVLNSILLGFRNDL